MQIWLGPEIRRLMKEVSTCPHIHTIRLSCSFCTRRECLLRMLDFRLWQLKKTLAISIGTLTLVKMGYKVDASLHSVA